MKCRAEKGKIPFIRKSNWATMDFHALHRVKRTARSPKSCFTRAGSFPSARLVPSPVAKCIRSTRRGLFTLYKVLPEYSPSAFTRCKVHSEHSPRTFHPLKSASRVLAEDFSPVQGPSRVLAKVFHPVQRAWRSLAEDISPCTKCFPSTRRDVLPSAESLAEPR